MSVISIPRLPDQVNVNFGPVDAIADVILRTDREVRDAGIRLSLSSDFAELERANELNRADWYPLMPNFDRRQCALGSSNAFWLKGIDRHGDVVLTHAVRLYTLGRTSLKDEIETLRFYYDDPEPALSRGMRAEASAPMASAVSGRVSYSGTLWVRSDYRGFGLARLVPPLSRVIALTTWYPSFHTCFVSKAMVDKGMGRVYGYSNIQSAVRIWSSLPSFQHFGPMADFTFCWVTTEEAEATAEALASRRHDGVGIGLERQRGDDARVVA
jgi:hypothetical protein